MCNTIIIQNNNYHRNKIFHLVCGAVFIESTVFDLCYISPHPFIKSDGCILLTNTDECFLLLLKDGMHVHVNFLPPFVPVPFAKPQLFPNQINQMSACCTLTVGCAAEKHSLSVHTSVGAQNRWTLTYGPPPHPTSAVTHQKQNRDDAISWCVPSRLRSHTWTHH